MKYCQEIELQYERDQEIQLLKSCSHPNVLPLYGISINFDKNPFEIGILKPILGESYKFIKLTLYWAGD